MGQRVFHPPDFWLTKDVNAFMTKNLTLIPEQKRELESDLVQESFLKDFEKVPGYKASFEFKDVCINEISENFFGTFVQTWK